MTQAAGLPLDGIRVLDLTTVVFGPYCTQTLADLGADVIKVETPGSGDAFRWSAPAARTPGMSPGFMAFNRGKRSLALDLKKPEDNARMHALADQADLFVVNVRGKALDRLGLGYDALAARNPRLIYLHCVGFGQDGPYADLQAYDDVIQAATGTATLLPRVDGNPAPRYLPSLIADKVAGLHAAYAAMAALFQRERTGQGQRVEVPMFEAFSHFMLAEHLAGQTFDPPNGPAGYPRQLDPDRQPFPTSDGYISIVAYTTEAWDTIFALVDAADFMADPRFATPKGRWGHSALLYQELARRTAAFTTDELLRRCAAAQIPAQRVRDIGAMLDDPHLAATGFFQRRDHPSEGAWIDMAAPVKFGGAGQRDPLPPPRLGECDGAVWDEEPMVTPKPQAREAIRP